jgi:hypothetical protein
MSRKYLSLAIIAVVLLIAVAPAGAVTKVARSYSALEFQAGYSIPSRSVDHLGTMNFLVNNDAVDLSSDKVFNSSFTLGVNYGSLRAEHWYISGGFAWSHLSTKNPVLFYSDPFVDSLLMYSSGIHFNQYDLRFAVNYLPVSLEQNGWSPYLGLGFAAGITSETERGYRSENETNVALMANFGAEVRLWQSGDKRSFVTLASANSWEFAATGYRPGYLTIGGALKYYMRP